MIVDQIELEVLQVGTTAAHGIDKLCESLKKLNTRLTSKGLDKLRNELMGVNTCLHMIDPSAVATVVELANALEKLGSATGSKTNIAVTYKDLTKVRDGVEQAGKAASKAATKFSKFTASLGRIAFYRALRTIIKTITSAFKEGLENAYYFSQGVNGALAQSLDKMATKTQTLKNQLGASLGELLQTAMPLIIRVVTWLTKLANALSQVFAALGGRTTYLKAVDSATKYADSASSAAKATKEWKNQLLGFDEINRLEDTSSSAASTGTDYSGMFQEASLDGWALKVKEFSDKVNKFFEDLKNKIMGDKTFTEWIKGIYNDVALWVGQACVKAKSWWDDLIAYWQSVPSRFKQGIDKIAEFFGNLWGEVKTKLAETFSPVIDFISSAWEKIKAKCIEYWGKIKDYFKDVLSNMKQFWVDPFTDTFNTLKSKFENALQYVRNFISRLKSAVKIPKLNISYTPATSSIAKFFGIYEVPSISVSWVSAFANGGFPDEGELFIAREAGAEMVGSINGRTAVANNDQIVEAVSMGVYEAVSAAMSNRNGNGGVTLNINGREFARAVWDDMKSVQREHGTALINA